MNAQNSRTSSPVESVIAALGGTVRRSVLVDRGFSDRHIRQAVQSGRIRRVCRGVYAAEGSSPMAEHLASNQAELTCFGRARQEGLWVLHAQDVPHVGTAHGRPVSGCVTHRFQGRLLLRDILRHCAQCGTELEILCVLESAVVKKKCTVAQLRAFFSRRNDARTRKIIGLIDPQSMSIPETCARYQLQKAGYNVQGQAYIRGMGHLDALVDGQLGLEIDGKDHHNNEEAWKEDLRRGNVLMIQDVPVLHFRAAVAMYFPEEMLRWIRQAFETLAARRR